ncbi:MAG: hypothetical protein VXW65_14125 [Pseudomonadota bacterium]|nr:hypothetical protein [Pseudomonadota bacterium]
MSVDDITADLEHWLSTLSGHEFYLGQNYHCPFKERLQGVLISDEQVVINKLITDLPYLQDLRSAIQIERRNNGIDREQYVIRIGVLEVIGGAA